MKQEIQCLGKNLIMICRDNYRQKEIEYSNRKSRIIMQQLTGKLYRSLKKITVIGLKIYAVYRNGLILNTSSILIHFLR